MSELYHSMLMHHGIKGQKWGVRRTPEELGHGNDKNPTIEKSEKPDTINSKIYRSEKGFLCAERKLTEFCLKPGGKHSADFFKIGYQPDDAELLFSHLEAGYDLSKKSENVLKPDGSIKYSIPMKLGVSDELTFLTAWQVDKEGDEPRFISAYEDRRLKGK